VHNSASHCSTFICDKNTNQALCNTLQYTAIHCNTLQHTATHLYGAKPPTTIRYSTLIYTATHCNTPIWDKSTHCIPLADVLPMYHHLLRVRESERERERKRKKEREREREREGERERERERERDYSCA